MVDKIEAVLIMVDLYNMKEISRSRSGSGGVDLRLSAVRWVLMGVSASGVW